MKISVFILFCFMQLVCAKNKLDAPSFGIYLLKNPEIVNASKEPSDFDPDKFNLDSVIVYDDPVISEKDIIEYDWNKHTILIDTSIINKLPELNTRGNPFIVIANGKRCYIGMFWTGLSSFRPPKIPIIDITGLKKLKLPIPDINNIRDDGTFKLLISNDIGNKIIKNKIIYNTLKKLGKLKE
jgi:hypothetical protein